MVKALLSVAVLAAALSVTIGASATSKRKPVVCMNYAIAKTDTANDDAVGICYETKKPRLFYRFEEVTIVDTVEGRRKVLLGWP
jgi:hypothetical protein